MNTKIILVIKRQLSIMKILYVSSHSLLVSMTPVLLMYWNEVLSIFKTYTLQEIQYGTIASVKLMIATYKTKAWVLFTLIAIRWWESNILVTMTASMSYKDFWLTFLDLLLQLPWYPSEHWSLHLQRPTWRSKTWILELVFDEFVSVALIYDTCIVWQAGLLMSKNDVQ